MKSLLNLEYCDYAYAVDYHDLRPLSIYGYFSAETLCYIEWYPRISERNIILKWKKNFVIELLPSYKHNYFDRCWR